MTETTTAAAAAVTPKPKNRIWEIDFARGCAIIIMLVAHFVMDFEMFLGVVVISFRSGVGGYLRYAFALFIFISGISATFSRSNFKRGLKLIPVAAAITLFTYLFVNAWTIKFGIIHFFASCMLLWPLFKKWKPEWLVVAGLVSIGLGVYFLSIFVPFKFLFPLGLQYQGFTTGDYFPIFPYFGVFLLGGAAGRKFYAERRSILKADLKPNFVNFLGRHSLSIYLFHQALFVPVMWLIAKIFGLPFGTFV